jgi:hypothetical protein
MTLLRAYAQKYVTNIASTRKCLSRRVKTRIGSLPKEALAKIVRSIRLIRGIADGTNELKQYDTRRTRKIFSCAGMDG